MQNRSSNNLLLYSADIPFTQVALSVYMLVPQTGFECSVGHLECHCTGRPRPEGHTHHRIWVVQCK